MKNINARNGFRRIAGIRNPGAVVPPQTAMVIVFTPPKPVAPTAVTVPAK